MQKTIHIELTPEIMERIAKQKELELDIINNVPKHKIEKKHKIKFSHPI